MTILILLIKKNFIFYIYTIQSVTYMARSKQKRTETDKKPKTTPILQKESNINHQIKGNKLLH